MSVRECPHCGSDELVFGDEFSRSEPNGTGWVVLMCADCGEALPDDGTRETRYWEGF